MVVNVYRNSMVSTWIKTAGTNQSLTFNTRRVSCIVYRVSCIVYRVSCIVYRVF